MLAHFYSLLNERNSSGNHERWYDRDRKRLDWESKDPNSESSILVFFSLWEINRLFSSDFPWFSSEDIVFATIVALIYDLIFKIKN